jgi:UDP-perosamine 4-acetyltransferase
MSARNVVILGTGGHAQVVWSAWQATKSADPNFPVNVVGWLETVQYEGPDVLFDLPVYQETVEGWTALHQQKVDHCYLGFGMVKSSPKRWNIIMQLGQQGLTPLTLIHPDAIVSPHAVLEDGCFIGARAVIQPFAHIGKSSIVNTGAIVEHHAKVGHNTHAAPGSVLCGETKIGNHVMLGAGAVVIQQKSVGDECTIGAGSVVIKNIPARSTAVGIPYFQLDKLNEYSCF